MSPPGPLEHARRALARMGASVTSHALDAAEAPPVVRRPAAPRPGVGAMPDPARTATVRTSGRPGVTVRDARPRTAARPGNLRPPHAVAAARIGDTHLPSTRARAAATRPAHPPARRAARGISRGVPSRHALTLAPLWRTRRAPIPWNRIPRERLRHSWEGLLAEHAAGDRQIELIGVYPLVPLAAAGEVRLGPGRHITIHLADAPAGPVGDLAVGRDAATGDILHHGVPVPG